VITDPLRITFKPPVPKLIQYRSFLNTDPPLLVDLWNRLPKVSGLVEQTDYSTLERHIFAKPYFDREGFSIAEENGKIVGFAHAGFSPQESLAELDYQTGIVSQLRLDASVTDGSIASKLLAMSVDYCRSKGATTIHAGCFFPHSPFYLGLSGGSKQVSGSVSYWDMQPLSNCHGGQARGLYNLSVAEDLRRGGIATYLVGESLKHLAKSNVTMVEAQTQSSDAASQALFEKLGFKKTSSGTLLSFSLV